MLKSLRGTGGSFYFKLRLKGTMTNERDRLHAILDLWWDASPQPPTWDSVLHPLRGNDSAHEWVERTLRSQTEAAQHLFRQWRALHAWEHSPFCDSRLLVGWPLAVERVGTSIAPLSEELSASLSAALLPLDVKVSTAALPLPVAALHQAPASAWLAWLTDAAPRLTQDHSQAPLAPGAYVWVSQLSCCPPNNKMASWFAGTNSAVSQAMWRACMRMEGLLEEQGTGAKVFPPTALWNAASFSRLAWARLRAGRHLKQQGGLTLAVTQAQGRILAELGREGAPALEQFEFEEELARDLAPLQALLSRTA